MDAKAIEALLQLFERSSLTEMVIEESGVRVSFKRQQGAPSEPLPQQREVGPAVGEAKAEADRIRDDRRVVRSPCVGTFASRPRPDSDAFVKVGDRVKEGDTLAVVEAMKILTEVRAAEAGVVEEILVADGDPVEYGQELIVISSRAG